MAQISIKVLGPGCANCKKLLDTTQQAVKELNIDAHIEYVTNMQDIVKYIMSTPGLVVDEEVVHQGKPLPDMNKVKELIGRKVK